MLPGHEIPDGEVVDDTLDPLEVVFDAVESFPVG